MKKKDVGSEEKSILFKVINSVDLSAQIGSYLKLRDKNPIGDSSAMSRLLGLKLLSEKKGIDIKGYKKISINQYGLILCPYRDQNISPKSLEKV